MFESAQTRVLRRTRLRAILDAREALGAQRPRGNAWPNIAARWAANLAVRIEPLSSFGSWLRVDPNKQT